MPTREFQSCDQNEVCRITCLVFRSKFKFQNYKTMLTREYLNSKPRHEWMRKRRAENYPQSECFFSSPLSSLPSSPTRSCSYTSRSSFQTQVQIQTQIQADIEDIDTDTDQTQTQTDTEDTEDTETDTQTKTQTQTQTDTDTCTDTETETQTQTDTDTCTDTETETQTQTDTDTDTDTDTQAHVQTEIQTDAEIKEAECLELCDLVPSQCRSDTCVEAAYCGCCGAPCCENWNVARDVKRSPKRYKQSNTSISTYSR